MINKQSIFAESGQKQATYSDSDYRAGMTPQTIAYAEDVNSFGNTMDSAVTAVCREVANAITEQGIALNANDNTQLSTMLKSKMSSGYTLTGVDYNGSSITIPTQNGNEIAFGSLTIVFNTKVYYGNTQSDMKTVTLAPTTLSASASWANGVYYIYALRSGDSVSIAYQQTPVSASEGATKCLLGSVFVNNGVFQANSWKFQPWLRITAQDMRESPTAETKGGFISAASANQLQMGALEIKDEGINFGTDQLNPNIMKIQAKNPYTYKFLHPGYDPATSELSTLDTSHVYNLTAGTWDDISSQDTKFMVLVPGVTPTGQTIIIPAMSYKSGETYNQLFDSVEEATSAVYGLPYTDTSLDKTRERVIYFGFSIVVKVNATDITDANQFAIVGMVPQALSGFTSAGGQTGGGTGAYIPMPEKTWASDTSAITVSNNASNIIIGHGTTSRSIQMPSATNGIVNQLEIKFTKTPSVQPISFPTDMVWWNGEPIFDNGYTYLIVCEYIGSKWYAGYLKA